MTTRAPSATLPAERSSSPRLTPLRRRWSRARRVGGALLAVLLLWAPLLLGVAGCGSGGADRPVYQDSSPEAQMDFGVTMAQRGLWNEALFRFQRAERMSPQNPQVLNNLAVAYEATGQYDEALTSYQQALQMSPENRELRRNYARFVEFYQSFRPAEEAAETAGASAADEGGAGGGGSASDPSLSPSLATGER